MKNRLFVNCFFGGLLSKVNSIIILEIDKFYILLCHCPQALLLLILVPFWLHLSPSFSSLFDPVWDLPGSRSIVFQALGSPVRIPVRTYICPHTEPHPSIHPTTHPPSPPSTPIRVRYIHVQPYTAINSHVQPYTRIQLYTALHSYAPS